MPAFVNPFPVPIPAAFDVNRQSIIVPGKKDGETNVYISAAFPHFPCPRDDDRFPETAHEIFELGLKTNPKGDCLGRRLWDEGKGDWANEFTWESYEEVAERRTRVGSGLMKLWEDGIGATERVQWNVGVWCPNQPEWQHASLACSAYSLGYVSLYDTLGPDVVKFMIDHSSTRIVFSSPSHIPQLLALACPSLKFIISVDSWSDQRSRGMQSVGDSEVILKAWGSDKGIKIIDIVELEEMGRRNPVPHRLTLPDDIASLCYTSGTTGQPKGAVMTHRVLAACLVSIGHGSSNFAAGGMLLSYLPLSHVYARFCEDACFATGMSIGYSCGDPLRILEDAALLKPTVFVTVPRVLNRLYQSIKSATVDAPGLKGKLCRRAFSDKISRYESTGQLTHPIWDTVLLGKLRALLGGRVAYMVTGSAPINPAVLLFLKVAFSCTISEGYGSTENCGTAVSVVPNDWHPDGTVGPPRAGIAVKLIDVPSMEYYSTDLPFPRGELLTRGEAVMPGYYLDEAKTKEAIDEDRWLHTGDVASVDDQGRFKIIDRIKNIVKLSQGEYVAVERLENIYSLCPLVAQILVHGDSLQDCVVAIVVVDPITFAPFASKVLKQELDVSSLSTVLTNPQLVAALAQELQKFGTAAKVNGYERLRGIHLTLDMFTMENDLLTPTMKMKRNVAGKRFRKDIDALYAAKLSKL